MMRGDRRSALAAYLAAGSLRFGERELFRIERGLRLVGRHDEADRTLWTFAAQNPRNAHVVRALANASAARRRWSDAARLLTWLDQQQGGRDAALLADLSYALQRNGQQAQAQAATTRAAALQSSRSTVRRVFRLTKRPA
jgi:D-alanyl-D-alanine carboxypeptidase